MVAGWSKAGRIVWSNRLAPALLVELLGRIGLPGDLVGLPCWSSWLTELVGRRCCSSLLVELAGRAGWSTWLVGGVGWGSLLLDLVCRIAWSSWLNELVA